jgi:hypothetical protein
MKMKKIEQGKYLYYINDNIYRIEQVNQVHPALWWVHDEKTNKSYGMFDTIKQFKEKINKH